MTEPEGTRISETKVGAQQGVLGGQGAVPHNPPPLGVTDSMKEVRGGNEFIDLEKAFDCVPQRVLWEVLQEYRVSGPLLWAIRSLYNRCKSLVRIAGNKSESFPNFEFEAVGTRISTSKSEAMVLSRKRVECTLWFRDEFLPQGEEFMLRIADANKLNKLIHKANNVVGMELDSLKVVSERQMLSKIRTMLDNTSHPLHDVLARTRRKRGTQLSPFKVPDGNSIFLLCVNEREDRKEEMRKFLALPIDEKTTHAARVTAKLKNELVGELEDEAEEEKKGGNEKMKNLKPIKSRTAPTKQTSGGRMKQEKVTKDNKHALISLERQKAVLELSVMTKRSEILRMDEAIAKEEKLLKHLERSTERDNVRFEEFLRENEKKSVEARTLYEQEARSTQEKNNEIRRLTAEILTIKSELARFEEILVDYKSYKDLLFKLSPPEWQEAQRSKVMSGKGTKEDQNRELKDTAIRNGLETPGRQLTSIQETRLSPAHSDSLVTDPTLDSDSSDYEDEPELYFTDPQQLLDLMTELTEQNLSLIQNSTRVEETLEQLQQSLKTTKKNHEKDEEQITMQINEMKERIEKEKARGARLERKVLLHVSLNTQDQDVLLDALSEKVAEVHRSCVDDRMTKLNTLEKLANIEKRLSLLLQSLESIPEEKLELMKKIKDSERRTREREDKLREQREKQKERMRRYSERSLADSKKISGKKLMPRYMPVTQRVKVSNMDSIPAQDEIHEYLFGPENTD
ncbi:cilia- and flagella-associated protein 100 [Pelmatolapia mariae]|uniref:cilia- and flagella-associated protein 100 n=1 Tax=Pelmatolapia mariae TaxID=158779 RepID=UPI003211D96B